MLGAPIPTCRSNHQETPEIRVGRAVPMPDRETIIPNPAVGGGDRVASEWVTAFRRNHWPRSALQDRSRGRCARCYAVSEVFSQRHERGSIPVTSNLPFDEWTEVFGSGRLTGIEHRGLARSTDPPRPGNERRQLPAPPEPKKAEIPQRPPTSIEHRGHA